ncbi:thiol reductant ABC exporter CydC subunit [Arthrobacter sp. W4I7]|nr:thiol reductant ABC exporter CydC subunit [Arthrobacter sp. W4I7]
MVAETVLDEIVLYLSGGAATGANRTGRHAAEETARTCLARAAAAHLAGKHPAELSPGELRRVALARGFARIEAGATVLLLDEPTAHLDDASAALVEEAIRKLRGTVTVILVAHEERTRALAEHLVPVGGNGLMAPAPGTVEPFHPEAGVGGAAAAFSATTEGQAGAKEAPGQGSTPGNVQPGAARLLAALLAPVRGKFAAAAAVGTLAAVFAVALSGLSGWLIIRAAGQPPILYLLTAIVGVRFFGIGRAVLRYGERLLLHDAVFSALTRLRGRLWESLSRRALPLRRLLQGGNVLGTVIDDVDTVRDLLPRVVLPPVTALAVSVMALVTTAALVPVALPAVLAASAMSLLLAPAIALWGDRRSATAEQLLRSGVLRRVAAALDARAELHANSVASCVLDELHAQDRNATAASQRSAWADGLGQAITTAACASAALGAAWLAAPAVLAGRLAPETAAVVVLLLLALVEPFAAMTTAVRQFPALRTVLQRVAESGALEEGRQEDGLQAVPARAGGLPGVELDGLSAAWPGGAPVFSGVDAVAEPGRWLAVTGPSGSGKSTLLSVLLGFLPAASGHVGVTGRAAWCPQEAHLFDSTIRGNLLLGKTGSADEAQQADAELLDVLASVGLNGLLERLPAGLDTRIGPGGAFLSGGERQRLAVARTLMTGAEVILLDEPTAHLDAASARAMLADLRHGLRHRTVVLVTHNPADIRPGDARLVLAPGSEHAGSEPAVANLVASSAGDQPSTS